MRNKEIRLILGCCAVAVAAIMMAFPAFAATINVPGDYPTIQEAVDNANPAGGDTVLCQSGTYTPVDFGGTPVTVECASPRNCVIDCDLEGDNYGAIFVTGEGPNSVLTGFRITDCSAAAIACESSSPTITNCLLDGNDYSFSGGFDAYNSSPTITNCDIEYNWFNYAAGGAYFSGGSPTITNSDFYRNIGGYDSYGGGIYFDDSSPTLSGCNVTWNSALYPGTDVAGGVCFFGGSPTVTGGSISYNTAWGAGGIYNAESLASLTMTGVGVNYNSGYMVGGILTEDASPTLTGCNINYNSNFMYGPGPVSLGAAVEPMAELFTGGAAFLGGSPTLSGCTLSYNSGWYVGGIINEEALASLTVSGGSVTQNGGYYVGGIATLEASPTISDCNISYNHAWGYFPGPPYTVGGFGSFGGSPTISGGNVSYNSAWSGIGGIRCTQSMTSPAISGVTVDHNEGVVAGGICFFYASGTIEDCTVTSNVSTGCGPGCHTGGIAVVGDGDVSITKTYVTQNQGFVGGIGAAYTSSPSVTNSMITGNTGYVGGVGCENAEILLTNSTIADNDGNTEGAGGIGGVGADTVIGVVNSILWGNTPSQIDSETTPTVTYSDVQGGYAGTGNINGDPMFLAAGDYHIFLASPCVDAATPTGAPADDIDGDPRPQGAGYDMGADENLPDDDGDGVPSMYEMGPDGDPGYDGNNDGYPDWMQGNVFSFPTVDGANYVTIACPASFYFTNAGPAPNPAPANTPTGVTFPYGFFGFVINDLPTGGATTVTIYLSGPAPDDYWKYGRTPDDPANHWYQFLKEEDAEGNVTGAENTGDTVITLYFVDGKRGDNDITANGTIIDPGAPAVVGAAEVFTPEAMAEDKSDSVCFIGTAAGSFGF